MIYFLMQLKQIEINLQEVRIIRVGPVDVTKI